jgi:hypothetical protein
MKQVRYCKTCLPTKVVLSWSASESTDPLNHNDSGALHETGVFEVDETILDGDGQSIWQDEASYLVIAFPGEFV